MRLLYAACILIARIPISARLECPMLGQTPQGAPHLLKAGVQLPQVLIDFKRHSPFLRWSHRIRIVRRL